MATHTSSWPHHNPEILVTWKVTDKGHVTLNFKAYNWSEQSYFGYSFKVWATATKGNKTKTITASISAGNMSHSTNVSATGNISSDYGDTITIYALCGDDGCSNGAGRDGKKLATINLNRPPATTKPTATYSPASGNFDFYYNTTDSIHVKITSMTKRIRTISTTDSNGNTISTSEYVTNPEFVLTISTSASNTYDPENCIYEVICDSSDPDYYTDDGGSSYNAKLCGLDPTPEGSGYCIQMWYIDDDMDNYTELARNSDNTRHWYATSRKEIDLTATAKTSTINITADNGNSRYVHAAANRDTLDRITVAYSTSPAMPDFSNNNVALNWSSPWNGILGPASAGAGYRNCFPIASNTDYYIHAVKSGSKGFDYNTWKYVHVKTGQVFISGSRTDNFSTHHVNIHIDACAILHNVYTDAYGGLHDDLYYGDISDPISNSIANAYSNIKIYYRLHYSAENITDWALVTQDNVQFHQDITISLRPHTLVIVEIKIEENVNVNGNTSGSSWSNNSIFAATNANVVKIGNNWAIPKIYDGSSWKETKARVFVGNSWHDTREAHYDYDLKRWVV